MPSQAPTAEEDSVLPCLGQTHLLCLLYDEDSPHRWFLQTLADAKRGVKGILADTGAEHLFPGCTEGLATVMQGRERESMAAEGKVRAWAAWLMSEGRTHGLRLPSAEVRARAIGLGAYFTTLDLRGRQLYDSVGLHVDLRSLQQRILTAVLAWSRDESLPGGQHSAPNDSHILDAWRAACSFAVAHCPRARLRDAPFPEDVLRVLQTQRQFPPGPPFP